MGGWRAGRGAGTATRPTKARYPPSELHGRSIGFFDRVGPEEELENRILTHGRDTETLEDKRKRLAQTNFWMPENNPDAGPNSWLLLMRATMPNHGKFALKQLYTVRFTATLPVWRAGNIVCCVSQKAITHQKAHRETVVASSCRTRRSLCPNSVRSATQRQKKGRDIIQLKAG